MTTSVTASLNLWGIAFLINTFGLPYIFALVQ